MSSALRNRLDKIEKVNPPRPLAGLSVEQQINAFWAKVSAGFQSEAEHELYLDGLSDEALDLMIADLNRRLGDGPDSPPAA